MIIAGVPKNETETEVNLKETINKIAACCGVMLKPQDVVNIYRLRESITVEHSGLLKHPLIMVKFDERSSVKQSIFQNYVKMIGRKAPLRVDQLGYTNTNRICLNHHLSPTLLNIRKQASDLRKLGLIERTVPRHDSIKLLINGKWIRVTTVQDFESKTSHLIPQFEGRGG